MPTCSSTHRDRSCQTRKEHGQEKQWGRAIACEPTCMVCKTPPNLLRSLQRHDTAEHATTAHRCSIDRGPTSDRPTQGAVARQSTDHRHLNRRKHYAHMVLKPVSPSDSGVKHPAAGMKIPMMSLLLSIGRLRTGAQDNSTDSRDFIRPSRGQVTGISRLTTIVHMQDIISACSSAIPTSLAARSKLVGILVGRQ